MNPGVAVERTTVLPHAAARSAAAAATSGAVASPEMTSTSFMAGTGLKKCRPTRRSGWARPAARAVGDRDEVLDASMASAATTASSSANSERLTARSSTIASITTAQPARPATESTAVRSSASGSTLRRPLATWALTRSRMVATARAAAPARHRRSGPGARQQPPPGLCPLPSFPRRPRLLAVHHWAVHHCAIVPLGRIGVPRLSFTSVPGRHHHAGGGSRL